MKPLPINATCVGMCPQCNKGLVFQYDVAYTCEQECGLSIDQTIRGIELSPEDIRGLLRGEYAKKYNFKREKDGRMYAGFLYLDQSFKLQFKQMKSVV